MYIKHPIKIAALADFIFIAQTITLALNIHCADI